MLFAAIILLVACVYSKKMRQKVVSVVLGVCALCALLYFAFSHIDIVIPILIIGFIIVIIIVMVSDYIEKKNDQLAIEEWLKQDAPKIDISFIENSMRSFVQTIYEEDANTKFKYMSDSIPYGRANCFLNYCNKSIDIEEPLYYSPIRSKDTIELREYGFLLTVGGIYIAKQLDKTDKDNNRIVKTFDLSLGGIWKVNMIGNSEIVVKYSDMHMVNIKQEHTTVPLSIINKIITYAIDSKITLAILKNTVYENENDDFDTEKILQEADENFEKTLKNKSVESNMSNVGMVASMPKNFQRFDEIGNRMNGPQGHGAAAEYAGDTLDKLSGEKTKIVGGNNIKDGADRIANGINIQTKFCLTPEKTVNDFLKDHDYHNSDGSMMVLEVPRDQYEQTVQILQEKIDNGEVPRVKKGEDARKYLRKSDLTYSQGHNIALAGSIEGITVDALSGIMCSAASGSITAVLTFASCVWNGADAKEAAKSSMTACAKTIGKSTAIYTITMQLSRSKIINPFKVTHYVVDGKSIASKNIAGRSIKNADKVYGGIDNPLYKVGEGLANKINSSRLAKTSIGKKLNLKNIDGKRVVSGGVMVAISYGPDICRALVGRISPQQLFKNAAVTTAGVAGAAIGNSILPVVGGFIGGAVGGFVAKKTLDCFIEDDAVEMYEILREEFIDIVMMSGLNHKEFEEAVTIIFQNKKLPSILRDMYAYGESREYAREKIVNVAVINIFKKRRKITNDEIDKAYIDVAFEDVD